MGFRIRNESDIKHRPRKPPPEPETCAAGECINEVECYQCGRCGACCNCLRYGVTI